MKRKLLYKFLSLVFLLIPCHYISGTRTGEEKYIMDIGHLARILRPWGAGFVDTLAPLMYDQIQTYLDAISKTIKEEKPIAITSGFKKKLTDHLIRMDYFFCDQKPTKIADYLRHKDNLELYYILVQNGIYKKIQTFSVFSEEYSTILTKISQSFSKDIKTCLFNKSNIITFKNNQIIKAFKVTLDPAEPQQNNIYYYYLGSGKFDFKATIEEIFLLRKSLEDNYLNQHNTNLDKIKTQLLLIDHALKSIDDSIEFTTLKDQLLNLLRVKNISSANTINRKILKEKNHYTYLLDDNGKELDRKTKRKIVKQRRAYAIIHLYEYLY